MTFVCHSRFYFILWSCTLQNHQLKRVAGEGRGAALHTNGDSFACLYYCTQPVPEIIDPVFAKTSPKRSFSMTEYERFRLVFTKTRVYKFGHWSALVRNGSLKRQNIVHGRKSGEQKVTFHLVLSPSYFSLDTTFKGRLTQDFRLQVF
jgi:hypothetical protein